MHTFLDSFFSMLFSSSFSSRRLSLFSRIHSSTSNRVQLPQELVDIVIDHLFDDKASLSACALVSPYWLYSARVHLFESVTLSKTTDCSGLLGLLDDVPQLTTCVRTVTVYGDLPFSIGVDGYEWLEDAFKVLSKLQNVKKINWWAFDWTVVGDMLKDNDDIFSTISELSLDRVRFSSVENIALFFRIFSTVTSLTLRDIQVTGLDLSTMPSLFSHSPRLRQLCLMSNGANGPLIDSLLLPHFQFDLRYLHTVWTPQLCLENHFQTLSRAVASTVQELAIVIKCNPSEGLIRSLRSFTSLRQVTFAIEDSNSDQRIIAAWLQSAVCELPRCLEQIVLEFNSPSCPLNTLEPAYILGRWRLSDSQLANVNRFPCLTSFCLQGPFSERATAPLKLEDKAQAIASCFPGVTKRGLTRILGGTDPSRVQLFP